MYSPSIPSPVTILSYFSEITRSFLRKKFTKNLLSIQKYTILIKWFAFFYTFFMNIFWTSKFYLWKAFNILLTKSTLQNPLRIIKIKQEKAQFRRLSRTFVLPKTDTGKKCKFSLCTNVYFFKKLEFFSNLCVKKSGCTHFNRTAASFLFSLYNCFFLLFMVANLIYPQREFHHQTNHPYCRWTDISWFQLR